MSSDMIPPSSNPYISPQVAGGPPPSGPSQGGELPASGLSITSMILGIVGIVLSCCCGVFTLPLSIGAVVTGFVAISQANAGTAGGKAFAITGLVCGFCAIGMVVLLFVLGMFMHMPGIMQAIEQAN